jgi:hypothetical protein
MEGGAVGYNFEMGLPKDYPSQIWSSFSVEFFVQPIYTDYAN